MRRASEKHYLFENEEEMLGKQLNEVSRLGVKGSEMKPRKQKRVNEEKASVKKKAKLEGRLEDCAQSEWRLEDCAQSIGESYKVSGVGDKKKYHFDTFKFNDQQYGLNDTVLLDPNPEEKALEPYVGIIKDIFKEGNEAYVKIDVQWFYRVGDVDKKHVTHWESKDSRRLFYSFHRDPVDAESVIKKCIVHFVPENKQIPNPRLHPGFIIQNIYDYVMDKMLKFGHKSLNQQQKDEIDSLVAKTTCLSKRSNCKSILEKSGLLTGDSDRDNSLKMLLKAVKYMCLTSADSMWPNHAVRVVSALEKALYDSLGGDIPNYNDKVEILVDEIKKEQELARRLLDGELKPEQVLKMTQYELTRGFTFDEMMAVI